MGETKLKKPPKPAPRAKVTEELFEEILIWYCQNGPQHIRGAKHFGLSRRTMSGLYFSGAPHLEKGPMKLLINTLEVKARALRRQMKQEELARANEEIQAIINGAADASTLSKVVDDSIRARAEEGAVVSASRRNILQLQEMLSPLLKGAVTRMKEMERDIKKLAPDDLVKLMKDLAKFQGDLINAAKTNMEMERLLLGDPNAGRDNAEAKLDQKGALKVLDLAARTMQRMRDEGRIVETIGEEVPGLSLLTTASEEDDDEEEDEGPGVSLGEASP